MIVAVPAGAGVLGAVVGGYLWGQEKELCARGSSCRWEADLLGAHVTSFEAAMGRGALMFAVVGLMGAAIYAVYQWITRPTH